MQVDSTARLTKIMGLCRMAPTLAEQEIVALLLDLESMTAQRNYLREQNDLLKRKLRTARANSPDKNKPRVCREMTRRPWVTRAHLCGMSLPHTIKAALQREPCRSLPEVGVGAIVLERCEYLRLAASIRKTETCWQWSGGSNRLGYGIFTWDGRTWQAHRFTYTLFVGAIPFGLTIDHLCRNRGCVNPEHLEAVTLGENVRRKPSLIVVEEGIA